MRIGYDDADSLITYPDVHNLSANALDEVRRRAQANFGCDPVQHCGWGVQSGPWDVGGAGLRLRVQLAARVSSTLTGRATM